MFGKWLKDKELRFFNTIMKIALCSSYHISSKFGGGNEQHIHHLAMGLERKGQVVKYFCTGSQGSNYPYKIVESKMFSVLNMPFFAINWHRKFNKEYELFHAFGSGIALSLLAFQAKYLYKIPTVLTYPAKTNPKKLIFKIGSKIEEILSYLAFDSFTTTTKFNENYLKNIWPKKKIRFIPLTLPTHIIKKTGTKESCRKMLKIDLKKKVVLFVGKLSTHQYYKGVEVLIKSAQSLPKNYLILIIGDGNLKDEYIKLSIKENVRNKIRFCGFVENDKLAYFYKSADVFVLPSTSSSEGFGISLIEAMYHCVPTITTKVIGSANWFKKEAGTILVNKGNPLVLAKAIIDIIENKNNLDLEKAKKFAESFSLENMTNKTINFYKEILNK